jgi:hypothetical protein
MAKPPVKPDRDSASDANWQMARHREDALKVLLETSSPAAVAEVAEDLRLSSAMVYRLLAVYRRDPSTSSLLPNRGGRGLRRSLLAVIASLIPPASMCRTLIPDAGRGLPFWTKLRACHSPADRSEFSQRTARWSQLAAAALDLYR